jgi:hypothetical protein
VADANYEYVDAFISLLGEVEILEVIQVFEDGFAGVEGLGPAGLPGKPVQTLFDLRGKRNCKHVPNPPRWPIAQLYEYGLKPERCALRGPYALAAAGSAARR